MLFYNVGVSSCVHLNLLWSTTKFQLEHILLCHPYYYYCTYSKQMPYLVHKVYQKLSSCQKCIQYYVH